jgi:hypothetical protein
MKAIISTEIELKKQFELIKKVFLVLETNSNLYANSTRAFTAFDNARKFVCYAGTSLLNIVRVCKDEPKQHMADKKMKSILQMCFSGSET